MIFWTGWLLYAGEDSSNKWRKRLFRVRDAKLEYLKVSQKDEEDTDVVPSVVTSSNILLGTASPPSPTVSSMSPVASEDKDKAVAKVVEEAPRDWINLEDVTGFFVFGGPNVSDPILAHSILLTSSRHVPFHSGNGVKLLFTGKRLWRLGLHNDGGFDIKTLFLTIERCIPRGFVLASGWVTNPGTINWNRRYAILLSTGNLLLFKDSSLENLRRDIWLGAEGCVVQPVKPLHEVGSPEERAMLESLTKSHQSSKSHIEALTLRVVHPSLDKKGYLMSLERLNDGETSSLHFGRFKEWLRLLQSCCKEALRLFLLKRTPEGAFLEYQHRFEALRASYESILCLESIIESRSFAPTPAFLELARAGFPKHLRPKLWGGVTKRIIKRETQKPGILTLYPNCRSPSFSFPLCSEFPSSTWLNLALRQYGVEDRESGRLILDLVKLRPSLCLSRELIALVEFISAVFQNKHDETLELLQAVMCDGILMYHVNSTTAKVIVLESFGSGNADEDESVDSSSEPETKQREEDRLSLSLQLDVQVALDLIQTKLEHLPVNLVKQCRPILCRWILSGFSLDIPFTLDCTERLWDLLILQLDSDNENHTCDMAIRLCVAVFYLVHEHLPLDGSMEQWTQVLTTPNTARPLRDPMIVADFLLYAITKDRKILKLMSWVGLRERRSQLWNAVELEARERAVLVGQWKKSVNGMITVADTISDILNKVNGAKKNKDRNVLSEILLPIHETVVSFRVVLRALKEAIGLCVSSLLRLGGRSSSSPQTINQGIEFALDESTGSTNICHSYSGQISLNPVVVIQVVRAAISLGWSLSAGADRCLAFADAKAFYSLSMLAKCVPFSSETKKEEDTSLSGLASLVRPPGEPKPSKSQRFGWRVQEELGKTLTVLLQHLDDIAQCIVDTAVEQQRRASEESFASKVIIPDIFGGNVVVLSRLVPFVMSSVEEIRNSCKKGGKVEVKVPLHSLVGMTQ